MILSILICTLPSRKVMFDTLLKEILRQAQGYGDSVEIICNENDGTTGSKRQDLLMKSKGEYITYIDDDDQVAPNYISAILKALESKPDCIGMKGWMLTNGQNKQYWEISNRHTKWHEVNGMFYRHTLHITPVKRSIALYVGFKPISHAEDHAYSMGLVGLVPNEVFIDCELYYYLYKTNK